MTEALVKDRNEESRKAKRIIWDHGFRLLKEDCHLFPATGHPIIAGLRESTQTLYVRTCDGKVLVADKVKIDGQTTTAAVLAARRTRLAPVPAKLDKIQQSPHNFVAFHSQLG